MKTRWLVGCAIACAIVGASLGVIAGSDRSRSDHAWSEVSVAADELTRTTQLRDEVARLRDRFDEVRKELDAAQTPAAATAARAALFQLRVDMVAVEDEIAVLASRRAAAHDF